MQKKFTKALLLLLIGALLLGGCAKETASNNKNIFIYGTSA